MDDTPRMDIDRHRVLTYSKRRAYDARNVILVARICQHASIDRYHVRLTWQDILPLKVLLVSLMLSIYYLADSPDQFRLLNPLGSRLLRENTVLSGSAMSYDGLDPRLDLSDLDVGTSRRLPTFGSRDEWKVRVQQCPRQVHLPKRIVKLRRSCVGPPRLKIRLGAMPQVAYKLGRVKIFGGELVRGINGASAVKEVMHRTRIVPAWRRKRLIGLCSR